MTYLETLTKHALRASLQPDGKLRIEPDWIITNNIRQTICNHREELVGEIIASRVAANPPTEVVPDYHILWVATDLDSFEEYDPRFGYELGCDPVYRMLDASYYAWLRHRMENARKLHDAGRLDDTAFEALRTRFNTIHDWAVRHIGEDNLKQAIRAINVKSYVPPSDQTYNAYRRTWDVAWNTHKLQTSPGGSSDSDQVRRLEHILAVQGYAVIRSAIVNDVVIFVRDDSAEIPTKWAGNVRFTTEELSLMVGSSPGAIKQIYEVKRTFGGKLVPADDDSFGGTVTGNQQLQFAVTAGANEARNASPAQVRLAGSTGGD